MTLLMLFAIPAVYELIIIMGPVWRLRRSLAASALVVIALSTLAMALLAPSVAMYGLLVINCYRVINVGRIVEGRLHETYLRYSVRRTSLWLISLGLLGCGLTAFHDWLVLIAVFQLAAGGMVLLSVSRQTRTTKPLPVDDISDAKLPTLTVAIPARDETADLEACLQTLINSRYPKLEILVLDDNSVVKKTGEIIRSFAHDGVRFIPGEAPRPNWLAKNQAYQRLAQESNSELILFCGVDIRFEADSLRALVGQLIIKNKQMLCVLPENQPTSGFSLTQPMRYAWELALPRRLFRQPPVLSSCWLIKRQSLKSAGGFAAATRMIVPEAYFADQLLPTDGYSFMRSTSHGLAITSQKSPAEQKSTAIRTRYPQLHKRIELTVLTSLAELIGFVLPLPVLGLAVWQSRPIWLDVCILLAIAIQYFAYGRVVSLSFGNFSIKNWLLLPLAVAHDIWLLNYSMWKYEFSVVFWKGRDVCPPVMHATPYIPKPS